MTAPKDGSSSRRKPPRTRSKLLRATDVDRSGPTIALPVALFVVLGLIISVSAATLLDPSAHDGGALIGGAFVVPMVVIALTIQLVFTRITTGRHTGGGFLWWALLVLPLGSTISVLPAVFRDPEYFTVTDGWSVVGVALTGLLLTVFGLLFGPLLWFFVVFPITMLVLAVVDVIRGRRVGWARFLAPLVLLALAAIMLFGAGAIDTVASGRLAWGSIIAAILGLPGGYQVEWPAGLWIVRALVLFVVVPPIVAAIRNRRRRAAAASSAQSSDGSTDGSSDGSTGTPASAADAT